MTSIVNQVTLLGNDNVFFGLFWPKCRGLVSSNLEFLEPTNDLSLNRKALAKKSPDFLKSKMEQCFGGLYFNSKDEFDKIGFMLFDGVLAYSKSDSEMFQSCSKQKHGDLY